jgi:NAD(P)-dependent dehydrogenase (short-subunit alcohol dehydrogenase family)
MAGGAAPIEDAAAPRVALVTGAGSGIGRAAALRLARDGFAVAATGRDWTRLHATADAIAAAGGRGIAVALDVTDAQSVRHGVNDVTERLGAPTALVHSAGVASSAKFADLTVDDWRRTYDVNVVGAFLVTQACLPGMTASRRGRVVLVGSTASVQGFPYVAHYVASKHALLGMARSLALEVAAKGVTVNCVCPGYVDTEMTRRTIETVARTTGRSEEDARRALEAASPQRRLLLPEEVAETIAWLCADGAGAISGQALVVNGG